MLVSARMKYIPGDRSHHMPFRLTEPRREARRKGGVARRDQRREEKSAQESEQEVVVLAAIDQAGGGSVFMPRGLVRTISIAQLATATGYSERTVARVLARLRR